jgi:hypothetical protein
MPNVQGMTDAWVCPRRGSTDRCWWLPNTRGRGQEPVTTSIVFWSERMFYHWPCSERATSAIGSAAVGSTENGSQVDRCRWKGGLPRSGSGGAETPISWISCVRCRAWTAAVDSQCCMDFDHRDPSTKRKQVTAMIASHGWTSIMAEVDKCDIVCANCHRLRTFNRRSSSAA